MNNFPSGPAENRSLDLAEKIINIIEAFLLFHFLRILIGHILEDESSVIFTIPNLQI